MRNLKIVLVALALTVGIFSGIPTISHADMMDKGVGDVGMVNEKAETAIKGFCPVCVIHGMAMRGNDSFVTVYKGKLYKFAGLNEQKTFIEDPETYTKDLDAKFEQLKR